MFRGTILETGHTYPQRSYPGPRDSGFTRAMLSTPLASDCQYTGHGFLVRRVLKGGLRGPAFLHPHPQYSGDVSWLTGAGGNNLQCALFHCSPPNNAHKVNMILTPFHRWRNRGVAKVRRESSSSHFISHGQPLTRTGPGASWWFYPQLRRLLKDAFSLAHELVRAFTQWFPNWVAH